MERSRWYQAIYVIVVGLPKKDEPFMTAQAHIIYDGSDVVNFVSKLIQVHWCHRDVSNDRVSSASKSDKKCGFYSTNSIGRVYFAGTHPNSGTFTVISTASQL